MCGGGGVSIWLFLFSVSPCLILLLLAVIVYNEPVAAAAAAFCRYPPLCCTTPNNRLPSSTIQPQPQQQHTFYLGRRPVRPAQQIVELARPQEADAPDARIDHAGERHHVYQLAPVHRRHAPAPAVGDVAAVRPVAARGRLRLRAQVRVVAQLHRVDGPDDAEAQPERPHRHEAEEVGLSREGGSYRIVVVCVCVCERVSVWPPPPSGLERD